MDLKSFIPEEGFKRDITILFFSILPALIAVGIIYSLGPNVYLSVLAVFLNFYIVIGVGWITSPIVGLSTGLQPFWLLFLLVFISTESSLIVSVNYDILEKIPYLGDIMKNIRERANKVIKKNKLAKNASYITIFWLMFIPIYGTGPMVMTLVGRIISLEWWKVWFTITLSSITRYSIIIIIVHYSIESFT